MTAERAQPARVRHRGHQVMDRSSHPPSAIGCSRPSKSQTSASRCLRRGCRTPEEDPSARDIRASARAEAARHQMLPQSAAAGRTGGSCRSFQLGMRLQDRLPDGIVRDHLEQLSGVVHFIGRDAKIDDAVQSSLEVESVLDQFGDLNGLELALLIGSFSYSYRGSLRSPTQSPVHNPGDLAHRFDLSDSSFRSRHRQPRWWARHRAYASKSDLSTRRRLRDTARGARDKSPPCLHPGIVAASIWLPDLTFEPRMARCTRF